MISWSADPTIMVSRSLSPAKIGRVISDEASEKLTVVVADDQLSLAIGKGGQNARLAAKLIGWKIDLVSQVEFDQRELIDAATRIEVEMMEGVGPKLAAKLIKAGLETVEDVHKASVEDLMEVPGVGAKTAEKLKKIADVAYHVARQAAEEARQEAEREAEEARKAEELSKAEEESKGKEKGQAEEALKGESEATEPEGEEPAGKEVSDAESAASEEGGEEKPPPDVGQDRPSESELDAVQEEPGFDSEGDSGAEEKTSPAAAGPDPEEEAK